MRKEYLRKLIKQRKPGEWLILALAFSVTLLHAGLLLVDIYQGGYGCELLLRGIGRLLTVYLMILAWRLRKLAFRKAIACSIVSMLLLMCSNYVYEEYIFQALLLLLGPICLFRLQNSVPKPLPQQMGGTRTRAGGLVFRCCRRIPSVLPLQPE